MVVAPLPTAVTMISSPEFDWPLLTLAIEVLALVQVMGEPSLVVA